MRNCVHEHVSPSLMFFGPEEAHSREKVTLSLCGAPPPLDGQELDNLSDGHDSSEHSGSCL